jgi:hypothetical protein
MQNMNKILKQAQKMQAQMTKQKDIEGSSGGGMVKLVMNGSNQLVSIKINPEVVNASEVEMLEDLILAAHANAFEKIKEMSESTFGAITGGLNLPGF